MSSKDQRPPNDADDRTVMTQAAEFPTGIRLNAPYLRVIHPRDALRSFRLDEEGVVVGRGSDADVTLDAAMISREHCRVRCGASGVLVEDLGSTNGTFIDGQRIRSAWLAPNNRLKIGPFVLKVEYKGDAEVQAEKQLLEAARLDPLTGVPNRGWFYEQAARLLAELAGNDVWLSTVMVDIDHFKRINDRYGHAAGDAMIRHVAQLLQHEMRDRDLLARYGGEEFVMILPHTDRKDALIFCDRIRETIVASHIDYAQQILQVRVSLGVYSCTIAEITTIDAAISAADRALYRAKELGRNRVSF